MRIFGQVEYQHNVVAAPRQCPRTRHLGCFNRRQSHNSFTPRVSRSRRLKLYNFLLPSPIILYNLIDGELSLERMECGEGSQAWRFDP